MKHIWCVFLPVRWCVLVERWDSTIVQLAQFMWKLTTPLAVLLGLDDQFCNSYCWTVYWEVSPMDEVTWVKIWWWKFSEQKDGGRWLILNWVTAGCCHTHRTVDYCTVELIYSGTCGTKQYLYWTNFLKSNFLLLLLYWAAQLSTGVFHLYVSCRCWCSKFCSSPPRMCTCQLRLFHCKMTEHFWLSQAQ